MKISIVVPVYNEEHNVRPLHEQLVSVLSVGDSDFEIIFVNDGSRDKSLDVMKGLHPLTIINFRKNFGQTAALDAGIKHASGDYVVTMDGDLQNDPRDIPHMVEYLTAHDLDVVSGWRKDRHDPVVKRFISRVANILRSIIVRDGIHDSGCTLKVYRRECLEGLDLYGEMHRFIPALLLMRGFTVGEMVVTHRARVADKTKYGFARTLKGFLDMLSLGFWNKYSARPLHLFGGVGTVLLFVSVIAGLRAVYLKLFVGLDLTNTFLSFLALFGFLIGILFVVFGLLADMLSKVYFSQGNNAPYTVKEVVVTDRA